MDKNDKKLALDAKKNNSQKDIKAPKGKSATGKPLDAINVHPAEPDYAKLQEAENSTAVMAFGRYNPPTVGHEKLINKVKDVASEHGGSAHIFASHSENTSKDPLPQSKKIGYLKKVAGKGVNVHGSSKAEPTIFHAASKLHAAGNKHLVVVAGGDRINEYKDKLEKYNGQKGKHGFFNFDSIKFVSAGERDPDAEGAEGMSGTKLRAHARAGEMKQFKSGLPRALHPHAEEIANHIRTVGEEVDQIDELSPSTIASYKEKTAKQIPGLEKQAKSGEYKDIAKNVLKRKLKGLAAAEKVKEEVEQIDEMDKSQPSSSRGAEGLPLGKKAEPSKIDKVKSDALKVLQKQYKKVKEEVELDERVLTLQQRRQRATQMRRMEPVLKVKRAMAAKRLAGQAQLIRRARKQAKDILRRRIAGRRGSSYHELGPSDKINIDRQVDPKVKLIKFIAARLMPRIKQAEVHRFTAKQLGKSTRFKVAGPVIQHFEHDPLLNLFVEMAEKDVYISENSFKALEKKSEKYNIDLVQMFEMYRDAYLNAEELEEQTKEQSAFISINAQCARLAEGLKDPKDNPCWKGYKPVGTKMKNDKQVPNCVPEETTNEAYYAVKPADVEAHRKAWQSGQITRGEYIKRVGLSAKKTARSPNEYTSPSDQPAAKTTTAKTGTLGKVAPPKSTSVLGTFKKFASSFGEAVEMTDKEKAEAQKVHRALSDDTPNMAPAAAMALKAAHKRLVQKHGQQWRQKANIKEDVNQMNEEKVSVDKKNYSWGKMITVHQGTSTSYPLHPEHQEKIKNLKSGEKTSFKDETNRTVTAHREGDQVHLSAKGSDRKTTVSHSHFTEEVVKELNVMTLSKYAAKARVSSNPKHKEGAKTAYRKIATGDYSEEVEEGTNDAKAGYDAKLAMASKAAASRAGSTKPWIRTKSEPELKHRVSVTVSDPHHTMVSKRGEKTEKKVRLYAKDEKNAEVLARHHFKKQGYKVHDSNYIGVVDESKSYDKQDNLPFTPDKAKKSPSALAGKHGQAYSTVRHLARMAMQKQIKKVKEEVENIEEVSKDLLARYKEKAGQQASNLNKAVTSVATSSAAPEHKKAVIDTLVKKGNKRFSGIVRATNKQFAKEDAEVLDEKLPASATAGDYVSDFQKSDAPQFQGKSKEKRRQMAIAAYLAAKRK